ncbi:LOW QUALITY PROTEIN: sperm-associated microtubule inner protein 4 [Passerculus sandwichensis]
MRSLCLPFSPSYPYPTHISRYTMFPNFRSLEGDTGINSSSHQSFHPSISSKTFDLVVLRKTRALPKSACSLSYEDFKPRYLDQHTILKNPVSLSKPSLPLAVKHEESGILLHRLCHQETCLPAWRPEDGPREITLPEWIPSCEVPQLQTGLMELQHSLSMTAAQKHVHDANGLGDRSVSRRHRCGNSVTAPFAPALMARPPQAAPATRPRLPPRHCPGPAHRLVLRAPRDPCFHLRCAHAPATPAPGCCAPPRQQRDV